jgi:signal transduction histidine kinase
MADALGGPGRETGWDIDVRSPAAAEPNRMAMPDKLRAWSDWIRRLPSRGLDIAVTVATTAATVGPVLVSRAWWAVALALLASVPVLWRRRAPVGVTAVVGLAMTALVIVGHKPLLPYGPLVGVYTIAAVSAPRVRLSALPIIAAAVYVSLVVPHDNLDAYRAVGTAFVAAYALGTSARAHRAQTAELAERDHRLAQERAMASAQERTRIARDMHDIVTHSVGLMVVQAEAGPLVIRPDPARAEAVFDAIADTGRGALAQLRGALGALRSDENELREPRPGLAALPGLIERTRRVGLNVNLTSDGAPRPVAANVDVAVFRIVQEALTNVMRHADARTVQVRLRWVDTALEVEVVDDGKGADGVTGGHGLVGMRDRTAACGGTLQAGPGRDGFVVAATLPVG